MRALSLDFAPKLLQTRRLSAESILRMDGVLNCVRGCKLLRDRYLRENDPERPNNEGVTPLAFLELRGFRKRCHFSQEDLADPAGLSRNYLSDIERCVRNPSPACARCVGPSVAGTLAELVGEVEPRLRLPAHPW
jgi:DNA-binding XRE family transcriptional regulator